MYTLTIKNNDGKTVVELTYDVWSKVREMAGLLQHGVAEYHTYNVQIYDNAAHKVVFNENTY